MSEVKRVKALHLTAGDPNWTPTIGELEQVLAMAKDLSLDNDEKGLPILVTRDAVRFHPSVQARIVELSPDDFYTYPGHGVPSSEDPKHSLITALVRVLHSEAKDDHERFEASLAILSAVLERHIDIVWYENGDDVWFEVLVEPEQRPEVVVAFGASELPKGVTPVKNEEDEE